MRNRPGNHPEAAEEFTSPSDPVIMKGYSRTSRELRI